MFECVKCLLVSVAISMTVPGLSSVSAAPSVARFWPARLDVPSVDAIDLTLGDFNNDFIPDAAVATTQPFGAGFVRIHLGTGGGRFESGLSCPSGSNLKSIVSGFFDSDSNLDVAAADFVAGTVHVHLGDGDGTLGGSVQYPVGPAPLWLTIGDVNGDQIPDLVTAHDSGASVWVLLGDGDGTFAPGMPVAAGASRHPWPLGT